MATVRRTRGRMPTGGGDGFAARLALLSVAWGAGCALVVLGILAITDGTVVSGALVAGLGLGGVVLLARYARSI